LNARELVALFRSSVWRSPEEAEAFAAAAGEITGAEIVKLLELVGGRGGPADAAQQRARVLAFQRLAERVPDKSLFAAYVRCLRTADPVLRPALVALLPRVNNVAEHPALVALLRSPDAGVRQAAAQALPAVGGKSAFDAIEQIVGENAFAGRSEALDAVLAMAPQHALPVLASVIAVGSPAEKVKALGHLTEPRVMSKDPDAARDILKPALGDGSEPVAVAAVAALSALADENEYLRHAGPLLDSRSLALARAAVDGLRMFPGPRAVASLHRKLRTGPNSIRLAVLDTLEAIGTSDVLAPLVDGLGHSQLAVRTRAGEALSRLSAAGKLDLARTVIWLLRSRDVNVRRMATELVQTVKDPEGELWPKLLEHLRDEDWWVRERVMDALAEMAGPQLVRHLAGFLQDPSEIVRRFGVDGLLRLRSPQALGTLVRTAAGDPDWWVRERALEAIAAVKDPRAVPHVIEIMIRNPALQVAALSALAEIGSRAAAPRVAELVGSDDADVQLAALRCLDKLDDPAQSGAVQGLLRDARAEVRALARALVERWGSSPEETVELAQPVSMLDQLLGQVARSSGDDLILAPGRRPLVKRMGRTLPLAQGVLSAEKLRALIVPHLSARQLMDLDELREVDFSYRVESEDLRFRANVFHQLGGLSVVFRLIRAEMPQLDVLGLPPLVRGLAELASGLVLVGGATGSGKSTTLAALVDHINRTTRRHIVTLEDPIEVVHACRLSLVNQREVGTHTGSFSAALRATLRQDPDVILVGEMRDLPTISFAVTAAETGHLVFGTLHTVSASGSVDRLVNAFPPTQQEQVRSMLAGSLRAVLCQTLLPRKDVPGRCLAVEILLNNDAVANLIRKGKTFQIPSVIATAREQGMQLMDADLLRLVREGKLAADEAYARAVSKKEFEPLLAAESAAPPPRRP
jgi:twitching motility protein PilT